MLTKLVVLAVCASAAASCHRENTYEGAPLAHWYEALADTSAQGRAKAAEIIANAAADHPETARRLLDALKTESDSTVHSALARALGEVVRRSGYSGEVLGSLATLTRDEHLSVRIQALAAIGQAIAGAPGTVSPPADATEALVSALSDPNWDVRITAAQAAEKIAIAHPDRATVFAAPLANRVLTDRVSYVRQLSFQAFTRLATSDSLAIPVYRAALAEDWPDLVKRSLTGMMARPATAAALTDAIIPLVGSDDHVVRMLAVRALGAAGGNQRAPALLTALRRATGDRDSAVRAAAAAALAKVAPNTP